WDEVQHCLDLAREAMKDAESEYSFYIRKWETLAHFLRAEQAAPQLEPIRSEARSRGYWETVRQCDEFEAVKSRDPKKLLAIYFGPPFESFRRHLLEDFKEPVEIPTSYDWSPCGAGSSAPVLDLLSGEVLGTAHKLKTGQVQHRLLVTL